MRATIARELMDEGDYAAARPYAEASVASVTDWGFITGTRCFEGLGEWDAAERCIRSLAESGEERRPVWYFWCRRTGRGEVRAAEAAAEEMFAESQGHLHHPTYARNHALLRILQNRPADALEDLARHYADTPDARLGMYAAGLADTLGRSEERDRYLQSVIDALGEAERRPKPMIPTNRYQDSVVRNQRAMATLAKLYQQAVAASPQALDERAVAELAGSLDRTGSDVYYVVALFFVARKQAPKAAGYLRLAAKTRPWNTDSSILASAALRDRGEEPPIPFPAVQPGAKQASTPLAPNPKPSPVPVANPGEQDRGAKAIQDSLDMARIYMNNGRREQAKAALQAAIKAHPDHPDAAKARQLLESLK